MVLRLGVFLAPLDAKGGEGFTHQRKRALIQKPGQVIGGIGQQFAACHTDEKLEILALDSGRLGLARRRGEDAMDPPEPARIAVEGGQSG